MKLVFLGTSAAQPTKHRGMSCMCLVREGEIIMFDVGEGTQMALQNSGLGWNKKMKIFVTHMHGDHCIGLLGLLQTMALRGRSREIKIYGPTGIVDFLKSNTTVLNFNPSFPIIISEINDELVDSEKQYDILCCAAEHSVSAYSYLFIEKDKPGSFDAKKADKMKIPDGVVRGKIKSGLDIEVDGKLIKSSELVGPTKKGIRIGISGDTRPTKQLGEFFSKCDYLIFESTFSDENEDRAKETGHSTAKEAGILAKKSQVKHLILTHFSTRYTDVSELVSEAKAEHESVVAAEDYLEIKISNE